MTVEAPVRQRTLALVGNPNVGKSVLFNALTGAYATVSNFPGTTVDVATGPASIDGDPWRVVDTPGAHSLLPTSEDESVTRDFLLRERPDAVLNVLDAKNLERGLVLTLELADHGLPLVVALNLSDEALDRGLDVDAAALERRLGVPVVKTVAVTGEGVPELKRALARAARLRRRAPQSPEIEEAVRRLSALGAGPAEARRGIGLSLLAGDEGVLTWGAAGGERALAEAADKERARFAVLPRRLIFSGREALARQWTAETVRRSGPQGSRAADHLGRWCLRPLTGVPIALAVLYVTYLFVGVFGAGAAVDLLEETVFGRWLVPGVAAFVDRLLPWAFLRDFLVGPYGIVSMALSYALALILPIVATFFLAFGLLEDSGYLPRLSVLLDRLFRLMGLNGRAALPVVLGLGCDTMATMTTRVLDTRKERVIVTLLLALSIPCSAQLAVIFGMTAGLSPKVLGVWLAVLIGTTLAVGWGASRVLPGARAPFLLEIPPIRRPALANIWAKMRVRMAWYMKEVVPLFIYGTAALFFLDRWGWLRTLERAGAPVVQGWLGLPAEATEALLVGFLRRDYGAAGLYRLQGAGLLDLRQVTVSLVLISLFMPCIAQWLMMFKERGWRTALGLTAAVMAIALGLAGALNAVLKAFPGWLV